MRKFIVLTCVLQLFLRIDLAESQNNGEIGTRCTSDNQCNPALFLRCLIYPGYTEGECYCREEFHYEGTKCRVQAEESCRVNPNCVKLSTCTSSGTDMVCKCHPGYKRQRPDPSFKAQCKALHDITCDSSTDCHYTSGLGCTSEKVCKCDSKFTTWSPAEERCLEQVGGRCEIEKEQRECIHGANCTLASGDGGYGECNCAPGYQVTRSYLCQLEFGAVCKSGQNDLSEQCNSDKYLKCGTAGKCECLNDNMIFDTECKVKPGGECDLSSNEDIPWNFRRNCISKAQCQEKEGQNKVGVCNCVRSSGDMCELSGGSVGNYLSKSLAGSMFLILVLLNVKNL